MKSSYRRLWIELGCRGTLELWTQTWGGLELRQQCLLDKLLLGWLPRSGALAAMTTICSPLWQGFKTLPEQQQPVWARVLKHCTIYAQSSCLVLEGGKQHHSSHKRSVAESSTSTFVGMSFERWCNALWGLGLTSDLAIDRIYDVYGAQVSVTKIINGLIEDKERGRLNPNLRWMSCLPFLHRHFLKCIWQEDQLFSD